MDFWGYFAMHEYRCFLHEPIEGATVHNACIDSFPVKMRMEDQLSTENIKMRHRISDLEESNAKLRQLTKDLQRVKARASGYWFSACHMTAIFASIGCLSFFCTAMHRLFAYTSQ